MSPTSYQTAPPRIPILPLLGPQGQIHDVLRRAHFSVFGMGRLSNRFVKPGMTRVRIEPGMPGHREVK